MARRWVAVFVHEHSEQDAFHGGAVLEGAHRPRAAERYDAGEVDHIHAMCGPDFYDDPISHPEVEKAYERWLRRRLRKGQPRGSLEYAGTLFEEYRGRVGSVDFTDAAKAYFFPVRVMARRPDTIVGFGETHIHAETTTFELRASEVASPRPCDRLAVGTETFVVQSEPERRDADRLVWTVDVRPA